MEYASRNKPGVTMKHQFGGAVSIPGTEKYITEL